MACTRNDPARNICHLAVGDGTPPKAVGDGTPPKHLSTFGQKRKIEKYARLAMKDHDAQDPDWIELRFVKTVRALTTYTTGTGDNQYNITFQAKNDNYGLATFEADLWEDDLKYKVLQVRRVSPSKGKEYTGMFCVPKVDDSPPCPMMISCVFPNRRRSLRLMQLNEMDAGQTMAKEGAKKKKTSADQANKKSKKNAEAVGDRPPLVEERREDKRKINEECAKLAMKDNAAQDAVGDRPPLIEEFREDKRKIIDESAKLAMKNNVAQDVVGDRAFYISPDQSTRKRQRFLYKAAAKYNCDTRLVLDDLTKSEKKSIDQCAKLAMKDHAAQDKHHLQYLKVVEARQTRCAGICYHLFFEAESDKYGVATFEAVTFVNFCQRRVTKVRLLRPIKGEWYTGMFCVPTI